MARKPLELAFKWWSTDVCGMGDLLFLPGALYFLIEHIICDKAPAHMLYGPIQMMCLQKYSCKIQLGVSLLKGQTLQPEPLCGKISQTEENILDNAISTVYAWPVSPSGSQIVQNLILTFHAMDVWLWYDLKARETHECQKC